MFRKLFFFIGIVFYSCGNNHVQAPEPVGPVPTQAQLAWHKMEMNAFIHFTTNTFTDKEWGFGDESPAVFNPSALDVDQWISTLKDTGFKGVILTTKHHDGFCLWPSEFTNHSVKNSPFKGDVVKLVADACRKYDMKFGVYLSPWDRNRSDYGTPSYITYYRNQLKELFQNYGPVFEMWFDGANGGDGFYGGARETRRIDGANYYDWPKTLDIVREMQSDVIFFSDAGPGVRWVGNEKGIAGETNWNTITPDTLYAGKPGIEQLLNEGSENGTHWIPAEVDVSIRPGWFYHSAEDTLVKSPQKLFDIYLTSVGRGSTLLLNVPPDKRGLLHDADVAALKGFRALLDNEFAMNHAYNATVKATNVRGQSEQYAASNITDLNPSSYWATDDDVVKATLEIDLGSMRQVKYIILEENIALGQRIKSVSIDVSKGGTWNNVSNITTVGYKRIIKIDPVETNKIRITINEAKAAPVLSGVSVY